MPTAAFAGYKGLVTTTTSTGGGKTKIGELRDYTLTNTHDTFDATSHDSSGERERIGGITGWTGSAEALYLDDNASQLQTFTALNGQTQVDFTFEPVGSTSSDHWIGTGFITGFEISGPNEDAAAVAIEMEGTGAITATTGA